MIVQNINRRELFQFGLRSLGLAMLVTASGCTGKGSLQALRDELLELRERRAVPGPSVFGLKDLRGVIHSHSYISHDSNGRPEDFLRGAREARLDYLVTTDHYDEKIFAEGLSGTYQDIVVIRGAEFPLGCTRKRGIARRCASILGFGFDPFPGEVFSPHGHSKSELIAQIKDHGGMVFLGHARGVPEENFFALANGMEIFNIADTMREQYLAFPEFLVDLFVTQQEYHEELLLQVIERPNWLLSKWDALTRSGHKLVAIGGNDAHQNMNLFGTQIDPYGLVYKILNTHVLVDYTKANSSSQQSAQNILTALRHGRSYVSFPILCDPSGFQFYAIDPSSGKQVAMMGDTWTDLPAPDLVIQIPRTGAIEIFKNGVPEFRTVGHEVKYSSSGSGVYRVEISLMLQGRWRPWIISNPIYL